MIWAVILFFGMGLFAESNGLVLSALTFGALCVAFAVFLILELGLPYTGMFRVNPAALQAAIDTIDKVGERSGRGRQAPVFPFSVVVLFVIRSASRRTG